MNEKKFNKYSYGVTNSKSPMMQGLIENSFRSSYAIAGRFSDNSALSHISLKSCVGRGYDKKENKCQAISKALNIIFRDPYACHFL